jgi:hypothetical protein
MSNNILLQKSELGKIKTGFHELPQEDHIYGKAPPKDKYGAREGRSHLMQSFRVGKNTLFLRSKSQERTS